MAIKFYEIVEEIRDLDIESKYQLKSLFNQMLIDAERDKMRINIDEGVREYETGKTKSFTNVNDLMKSLNDD